MSTSGADHVAREIPGEARLRRLAPADLESFSVGAALLGSGGGGRVDYWASALRLIGPRLQVDVVPLAAPLPDRLAMVGLIGSTMVMEEKVPSGREMPRALAMLERWAGTSIGAVLPAQIGGVTSLAAILVAHQCGLPVVDADFDGRAIPRLDQLSLFGPGMPPVAATAVTSNGIAMLVDEASADDLEAAWRDTVIRGGGWAAFAIGPISPELVRARAIEASLSRAVRVGRELLGATDLGGFADRLGGRVVATGKVIGLERYGEALSFVHNSLVVLDSASGAVVRLEAGSEYLLVLVDGEPIASTPSVIALLDPRTHESVAVDDVRMGRTVAVLVLPGAPWWREDDDRLAKVSPRAYGVDFDVVSEVTR
jgi:DUF917 family protein